MPSVARSVAVRRDKKKKELSNDRVYRIASLTYTFRGRRYFSRNDVRLDGLHNRRHRYRYGCRSRHCDSIPLRLQCSDFDLYPVHKPFHLNQSLRRVDSLFQSRNVVLGGHDEADGGDVHFGEERVGLVLDIRLECGETSSSEVGRLMRISRGS